MQMSTPTSICLEKRGVEEAAKQESKSEGRKMSWGTVNYSIMGDKMKKRDGNISKRKDK